MATKSWLAYSFLVLGCGNPGRVGPDADQRADAPRPGDRPPLEPTSLVYAHSSNELFRINTTTLSAESIGALTGLGTQGLTDLAVSRDDRLVGITLDKLFEIDPETGACTVITDLSGAARGFTSLSFVPVDLADPDSDERLVAANNDGVVFEINAMTGTATELGRYGTSAGQTIRSSGDIVAVSEAGIFATVNVGDTFTDPDYLARINPATWEATLIGEPSVDRIFGLAYWAGQLYGFVDHGSEANNGSLWKISPVTGAGEVVLSSSVRWFGAGVTTDAPIVD